MILWGASKRLGPLAPPGTYRVRLTSGGKILTQSFEVKLDPRLKGVTLDDVKEEFKAAIKIRDRVSQANEAVIKIREIKAQLIKADPIANKKIIDRLSGIEENIYQVKNQSAQDPLNFPIKVNNRLAALESSIEVGDARPTDASYKVYDELSAELQKYLDDLDSVLKDNNIKPAVL